MKVEMIIDSAIEHIKSKVDIAITWHENETITDNIENNGTIQLIVAGTVVEYLVLVRQEVRIHQINQIEEINIRTSCRLILIAHKLSSEVRVELRNRKVAYIEANGNLYIEKTGIFLFIDGQNPLKSTTSKVNRAFTKTGLKVIFHLLIINDLVNRPYREIASTVDVALGNINYVFNGLKELGFLLQLTKDELKLTNKKELLDRWVTGYSEKLKPSLFQGTFAFKSAEAQKIWSDLKLKDKQTLWSGEPAGDLFTDHLRPEIFTIYTAEKNRDLIKNYKFISKMDGNINIYEKFWRIPTHKLSKTVPPLLVYADLIITNDKRCQKTAKLIYDKYIQPNL